MKQVTIGKRKIPTIKDGDILQVRGDLIIKRLNSHKGEKRVRVVHDSYKPKKISSYEAHLRLNLSYSEAWDASDMTVIWDGLGLWIKLMDRFLVLFR